MMIMMRIHEHVMMTMMWICDGDIHNLTLCDEDNDYDDDDALRRHDDLDWRLCDL